MHLQLAMSTGNIFRTKIDIFAHRASGTIQNNNSSSTRMLIWSSFFTFNIWFYLLTHWIVRYYRIFISENSADVWLYEFFSRIRWGFLELGCKHCPSPPLNILFFFPAWTFFSSLFCRQCRLTWPQTGVLKQQSYTTGNSSFFYPRRVFPLNLSQ